MSGGTKHDQGKPQMGLMSQVFLMGLSRVLTFGATKYASHNWRKGIAYSRLFDALMRHLWAWWGGEEIDPESGECHLDHAACCLMFLREMREDRADLDDRYFRPIVQATIEAKELAEMAAKRDQHGQVIAKEVERLKEIGEQPVAGAMSWDRDPSHECPVGNPAMCHELQPEDDDDATGTCSCQCHYPQGEQNG
jgi:hypothetical protein